MVMGVCLHQFCLNIKLVADICLFSVGPGYYGLLGGVIYGEWHGVCDFVVLLRYVLTMVV